MTNSYEIKAKKAIEHAIEGQSVSPPPLDQPTLRVHFNYTPDWTMMHLIAMFSHDSFFVFGQAIKITAAYNDNGHFVADFEFNDRSKKGIEAIVSQLLNTGSSFDDLICKYRITSIEHLNFLNMEDRIVKYISPARVEKTQGQAAPFTSPT